MTQIYIGSTYIIQFMLLSKIMLPLIFYEESNQTDVIKGFVLDVQCIKLYW